MWGGYQSAGGNKHIGGDLTGGIVGVGENCTIIGCANYASVGGGCSVGGIAGNISGAVLNYANYGLVDVVRDAAAGIACRVGANTIISGCINEGTIDGQSVGGIVGQTQDDNVTVTNCANLGIIQTVSGGGIIDYVGSTAKNAVISKCFNSADIVGKDGGAPHNGGVVGTIGNGTVTDCYNTGVVATGQAAASQGIPGTAITGGVIGIVNNGFDDNGITVRNCYNTGAVSSASTGPLRLGGIVGWENKSAPSDITIANCYYLENSAPGGLDGADAAGAAEVRTAAALQGLAPMLEAAYVADTAPSVNNGYPILAWQADTACTVTFALGMEGVTVTVTDSTGATVAPDEAGGYVYTLSVGDTYTYTAAAEGYATVWGSLTPANDATVAINMFIYGDIHLDGKVNAKDAALLAQYLAGSQTLTMGQLAAADVYHDGKANAKDAALFAQFLAGQGVSLD